MKLTYVQKIETVNTGGGCYVDLVTLPNGQVLGINDECVVLYDSVEDFWGVLEDTRTIDRQAIILNQTR